MQDRLVKELRLAGASGLAEGNALLPAFTADYNMRFAKAPSNSKDLHRRLRAADDLDDAFTWKEERTLSRALTLQYDKVLFILEPSEQAKAAIGKRVTVVDYPDGRLAILYKGLQLAYRVFDKIQQVDQAAIIENKRLGAALAFIREQQLRREPERRSTKAPRRRERDARPRSAERRWRGRCPLGKTTGAVSSSGAAGAGRALRCAGGSAPARRPTPTAVQVTFLNGRIGDISIWWTHDGGRPSCSTGVAVRDVISGAREQGIYSV